jgi:hypothetical protein
MASANAAGQTLREPRTARVESSSHGVSHRCTGERQTVVIDPIRIVNATGNVRTLPSDVVKGARAEEHRERHGKRRAAFASPIVDASLAMSLVEKRAMPGMDPGAFSS